MVTDNLTGVWHGLYSYDFAAGPIYFVATLLCGGSWLSGTSHEAINEIHGQTLTLFAAIEGHIEGQNVSFVKTYDGTGGWSHMVPYQGVLSTDKSEIEGTWHISQTGYQEATGRFLMIRNNGANEAVVREVYERA